MFFGLNSNFVLVKGAILCLSLLSLSSSQEQTNVDDPNALPAAGDPNAAKVPVSSGGRAVSPVAPVLANVVDQSCLQCLCLASTGCKAIGCHLAGPNAYYCGVYLVSWAYWADAGKPGDDPTNPFAFERCLNNTQCAEQTIQQYMSKYGRDCNGDNRIDCTDYVRIHKAGPGNCEAAWIDGTQYWRTFLTCNPSGTGGRPVAPVAPVQPVAPVSPVAPVQPVAPVSPVRQPTGGPRTQTSQPPTDQVPLIDVRTGNRQQQQPITVNL